MPEVFVYHLASKLGGRKEVLTMPAKELFGAMDAFFDEMEAAAEKERARFYMQYLIQVYSAPSFGKPDPQFESEKKKFLDNIRPGQGQEKEAPAAFEWDEETKAMIIEHQEGG